MMSFLGKDQFGKCFLSYSQFRSVYRRRRYSNAVHRGRHEIELIIIVIIKHIYLLDRYEYQSILILLSLYTEKSGFTTLLENDVK